mmetsp:Transcript_105528/g.227472  ORF Transcript_105528/g.227472 Transcript_105528/m.227472 type:complete len:301 (-) Transcript_105528:388-1290(-)
MHGSLKSPTVHGDPPASHCDTCQCEHMSVHMLDLTRLRNPPCRKRKKCAGGVCKPTRAAGAGFQRPGAGLRQGGSGTPAHQNGRRGRDGLCAKSNLERAWSQKKWRTRPCRDPRQRRRSGGRLRRGDPTRFCRRMGPPAALHYAWPRAPRVTRQNTQKRPASQAGLSASPSAAAGSSSCSSSGSGSGSGSGSQGTRSPSRCRFRCSCGSLAATQDRPRGAGPPRRPPGQQPGRRRPCRPRAPCTSWRSRGGGGCGPSHRGQCPSPAPRRGPPWRGSWAPRRSLPGSPRCPRSWVPRSPPP